MSAFLDMAKGYNVVITRRGPISHFEGNIDLEIFEKLLPEQYFEILYVTYDADHGHWSGDLTYVSDKAYEEFETRCSEDK